MSTQFPLVSVVIPNYNYAATLGPCIRAVQAQTYPNLEIVVADDCSTDNSVEIARSLGPGWCGHRATAAGRGS